MVSHYGFGVSGLFDLNRWLLLRCCLRWTAAWSLRGRGLSRSDFHQKLERGVTLCRIHLEGLMFAGSGREAE